MQNGAAAHQQSTGLGSTPGQHGPRVSIGLPVYNGERFLPDAIESILAQRFEDFELLILDNASTDATEEIGRCYAARDRRVRFVRNPENIGATRNHNRAFALTSAPYFKWASHDDVLGPDFLKLTAGRLDEDPHLGMCTTLVDEIDGRGMPLRSPLFSLHLSDPRPHMRLRRLLKTGHNGASVFGLHRRSVLARSGLFRPYHASDRVLLVELAVLGRWCEIPVPELHIRDHTDRSIYAQDKANWAAPGRGQRGLRLTAEMVRDYCQLVARAPMPTAERARCMLELAQWWQRSLNLRLQRWTGVEHRRVRRGATALPRPRGEGGLHI